MRVALIVLTLMLGLPPGVQGQGIEWGVKGGVQLTSVERVPEYYDWFLCCHPLFPDAKVDANAKTGGSAGLFVTLPIRRGLGIQTEVNLSRRRHSVNLEPYEPIDVTFTRDAVEAAALLKLQRAFGDQRGVYVVAGPVVGFRIGESADSNEPRLKRGDPETDVYVAQVLAYATPELLRRSQLSVALAGGLTYRKLLLELRLTQGLQSIFKNEDGLIEGFVEVGGDEATLRDLAPRFVPLLHAAKGRDVAVLLGFRF